MRTIKTEGIIIKRFNVGEADRILTVFTKRDGKYSIRAKGIRRVPSRRSAHVELLNYSQLTLYMGRSMPVLIEATATELFRDVKDDLTKVGFAYHICELINGLCPENQENQSVFTILHQVLTKLSEASVSEIPQVVHDFEIELLTSLGYWNSTHTVSQNVNTTAFIEHILEKRLRSRSIFTKL